MTHTVHEKMAVCLSCERVGDVAAGSNGLKPFAPGAGERSLLDAAPEMGGGRSLARLLTYSDRLRAMSWSISSMMRSERRSMGMDRMLRRSRSFCGVPTRMCGGLAESCASSDETSPWPTTRDDEMPRLWPRPRHMRCACPAWSMVAVRMRTWTPLGGCCGGSSMLSLRLVRPDDEMAV
jgi:hypothetical protein